MTGLLDFELGVGSSYFVGSGFSSFSVAVGLALTSRRAEELMQHDQTLTYDGAW